MGLQHGPRGLRQRVDASRSVGGLGERTQRSLLYEPPLLLSYGDLGALEELVETRDGAVEDRPHISDVVDGAPAVRRRGTHATAHLRRTAHHRMRRTWTRPRQRGQGLALSVDPMAPAMAVSHVPVSHCSPPPGDHEHAAVMTAWGRPPTASLATSALPGMVGIAASWSWTLGRTRGSPLRRPSQGVCAARRPALDLLVVSCHRYGDRR